MRQVRHLFFRWVVELYSFDDAVCLPLVHRLVVLMKDVGSFRLFLPKSCNLGFSNGII